MLTRDQTNNSLQNQNTVEYSTVLPTHIEQVFAYHARPGALQRLLPPWERLEIVRSDGSIAPGSQVVIRMVTPFGISSEWHAQHDQFLPPFRFSDFQVKGPMAEWNHLHLLEDVGEGKTKLTDRIAFQLPFGATGKWLGEKYVSHQLARMFHYRHRVTREDLAFRQKLNACFAEPTSKSSDIDDQDGVGLAGTSSESKRIAITGGNG